MRKRPLHDLTRIASDLFAIDVRSLAALRVGLGALLVTDLFNRSLDLAAHPAPPPAPSATRATDVLVENAMEVPDAPLLRVEQQPFERA